MRAARCGRISVCRGRKTASLRVNRVNSGAISPAKTLTLGCQKLGCAANAPPDGLAPTPDIKGFAHGQSGHHQGQARFLGGYRLLLRRQEEFAHHDRQAGQEEVRSGRAQARRIPRVQDQVISGILPANLTGPRGPVCVCNLVGFLGPWLIHTQTSSPANGSAEWPPDDRLRRVTQYSRAPEMGSESCGVLDTPLEPVIGLAGGETRWRSMTANDNEAQRFTAVAAQASAATTQLRPLCLARHRSILQPPSAVRSAGSAQTPPG